MSYSFVFIHGRYIVCKINFKSIFRKNNLSIIVKCNLKTVDYLDVTINLSGDSCKSFHKPNSEINYIHRESNHPPSIIKQLPLSVESYVSKLSSDEIVFIEAASVYQEPLKRAGNNHKLSYNNHDKYNCNNNNNDNKDNCNNNVPRMIIITMIINVSLIIMIIGIIMITIITIIILVVIKISDDNNNRKVKFNSNDNRGNNNNLIPIALVMIIRTILKTRIIQLLLLIIIIIIIIITLTIMLIITQGQANSEREA